MLGRPRGPNYRPRNTGRGQARGERVGGAVLTEAIVRRIRELRREGLGEIRISRALAAEGITATPSAVRAVIDGDTWRHVQ